MVTITQAMKLAECNIKIEGIIIPVEQKQLTEKLLRGEISEPEFFKQALEMVKNEEDKF